MQAFGMGLAVILILLWAAVIVGNRLKRDAEGSRRGAEEER